MSNLWNVFKVQYVQGHDLDDSVPLGKVLEDYARWLEQRHTQLEQLVKEGLALIDPYAVPDNGLMEWTARAKALLEQEVK